jgi:hypothetical protein
MIKINCSVTKPVECTFEVTDAQLDVMVAAGVDVTEEWNVSDFYRKHLGETIDGVWFMDLHRIADDYEHTGWPPEIEEWDAEGEAPERFWPDEPDEVVSA